MHQHKIFNTYPFLFVFILLSSCNGQTKDVQGSVSVTGEFVSGLDNSIWEIYQDQNENYWFGSNGNGIYCYDGKKLKLYTEEDGLLSNTIRDIQEDSLGNLFIGTQRKGVSKYDGNTFTTLKPIRTSLNDWKLEPHDLWFHPDGHIYRYDGKSLFELKLPRQDLEKAFGINVSGLNFKGMNSSPYAVYGIDQDKAGNLWIGLIVAGAFRYDGKSFLWIPETELSTLEDGRVPGVRSLLEDKNGDFWLSNFISRYRINEDQGVVAYEKLKGVDTDKYFPDRLPYFNAGLSDQNGDLWMTTYTGGVWKLQGNELLNFPVEDGDTEALIISIYEDRKGVLWIGTDNLGVFKFNGKTFDKFEPIIN
ncbi:MAG: two-component regulator propeller domain-containing protein [Saprospiraceae bacterium]